MCEILGLIGLIVINSIVSWQYSAFYAVTINASISLCLAFILFMRVFLLIVQEKVWKANTRHFILCFLYFVLMLDGILGCICFSGDFIYNKAVILTCRLITYTISFSMLIIHKIVQIKSAKLYGKPYLIFILVDAILIILFSILDIVVVPQNCGTNQLIYALLLLLLLCFTNYVLLYYREYWIHKKTLLSKFDTLCKRHKEYKLFEKPECIKDSSILKEVAYVLDLAPVRVIEVNLIIKQLHDILVKNGVGYQKATSVAAEYSAVIISNLMRREYDFSLLFRPIVKMLQTYKKTKNNKRNISLSL